MLAKKIVREIMKKEGIGTTRLAEMLGYSKRPQKICDRLSDAKSSNLGTEALNEMIRAMGYKAIIVPESAELKDGWYEIDSVPTRSAKK